MNQNQLSLKIINHIKRLPRAFSNSISGLKSALQSEAAFRLEIFLSVVIIPSAFIVQVTAVEKALLLSSWFLVLIIEIINSALESLVDRIGLEIHPLSKKIKDLGSAAVLISIVNVVIVWLIILH